MLDLATVLALAADCAPDVSPRTLAAVAYAESRFDPLAIGVNRGAPLSRPPTDRAAAVRIVRARLADGGNLDLGLAQINSANLDRLGLSAADAFDPCRNLTAAGVVLREGYRPAGDGGADAQVALRRALSRYNTGHPTRGLANGYVARVESALRRLFGARRAAADLRVGPGSEPGVGTPTLIDDRRPPPPWDVFARARSGAASVVFGTAGRETGR